MVPAPITPDFVTLTGSNSLSQNTISGVGALATWRRYEGSEGTETQLAPNAPKLGGLVPVVNNR